MIRRVTITNYITEINDSMMNDNEKLPHRNDLSIDRKGNAHKAGCAGQDIQ
jgi:hypothetical protein